MALFSIEICWNITIPIYGSQSTSTLLYLIKAPDFRGMCAKSFSFHKMFTCWFSLENSMRKQINFFAQLYCTLFWKTFFTSYITFCYILFMKQKKFKYKYFDIYLSSSQTRVRSRDYKSCIYEKIALAYMKI